MQTNFRIPKATLLLLAVVFIVYFSYSQGTLFLPASFLDSFSLAPESVATVFTYLFLHIGVFHLVGNAVSLAAFGFLLEQRVESKHVIGAFVFSGVAAGLIFAFLNPGVLLAGASAGIAGLMAASVLSSPKRSLAALIAVPLLISFVFFPLASIASEKHVQSLEQKQERLAQDVERLVQENKTEEARQVNVALVQVREQVEVSVEGQSREESTPTDFMVHLYGAVFGVAFLFVFSRKSLKDGVKEFESVGEFVFNSVEKLKRKM